MKRVLLIDSDEALFQLLTAYLPDVKIDRARNETEQNYLLAANNYNLIFVNRGSSENIGLQAYLKANAPIVLNLEFNEGRVGFSISSRIHCEISDIKQLSLCVERLLKLNLVNNDGN